jgi:hypothetical protein
MLDAIWTVFKYGIAIIVCYHLLIPLAFMVFAGIMSVIVVSINATKEYIAETPLKGKIMLVLCVSAIIWIMLR